MIRKLFLSPVLLLFLFTSCNRSDKESETENNTDTARMTVAAFDTSAYHSVGKPVIIEGTVLHTCKHGGKRMFLADGNDSVTVEITTGPDIPKFDENLVGSRVRVTGILKEERIDEKYLNEWEAEVKKPAENHDAGIHTGTKGHIDQGVQEKLDQINSLREQLKNSRKDHLSNFSIEAISFKEIKK